MIIVGDCHGKQLELVKIAKQFGFAICVGDIGFAYDNIINNISAQHLWLLGGNHDNYSRISCPICFQQNPSCWNCQGRGYIYNNQPDHFLGDYGYIEGVAQPFFFVRGAWSIDWQQRTPGFDLFPDEQLTLVQANKARLLYEEVKPELVITHTCPASIIPDIPFERLFGNNIVSTFTDNFLEELFDIHQPRRWIFGHFHISWTRTYGRTTFTCLDELEYIDLSG